ncbi:MAG TPA: filamentous hemagglutinin N-terminal domain-containing protein, partial [Candidatus Sericytochromatia bacterium]
MVGRSQRLRFVSQVCCLTLLGVGDRSVAQVIPDTTLSSGERSQVSAGPLFQIDGGAIRDRNLFHSFAQFSLRQGETAFFNNAATITNIISRVTGGQPSQLDGLIQTSGSANLFFINPSGILFGPNAALNVGGTFLATTASAIQFGNQGLYSATSPNAPLLLTVKPSALLFNQLVNQPIVSQAKLQVPSGQSLALVGGNILLNQGALLARGGRVELGGLSGQGVVALNGNGSSLRLSYRDLQQPLADLALTNGTEVNVRTGGSISVNAQNFRLAGGSRLQGGVAATEGIPGSKAGDIDLNVSGALVFTDGSLIDHATLGNGDSGNVNVTAGSILLKDGSQITASTFGRGNSGTVTLRSQGAVVVDG